MKELKVFTVEEANQLIPKLTEMLRELQAKQEKIFSQEVEIDALEILYPGTESEELAPPLNAAIKVYEGLIDRFYSLVDEIHGMGCFLKDIEMGLIDFYTLYQDRVVYLCWKLGEPAVGFWHEVGRGFAYRQPIIQEDERESSR